MCVWLKDKRQYRHLLLREFICTFVEINIFCFFIQVTLNIAVQHQMSVKSLKGAERLARHAASPSA